MTLRMLRGVVWIWVALAPSLASAARPYRGGAVATVHPAASQAALTMLNRGGNAVDGAVAAAFALAVVDPYHSGLGGGGFALIYDARRRVTEIFDFREVAPAAASADMYLARGAEASLDGVLSIAVPGAPAGYLELLKERGKLSPNVVVAPAVRAARDGFWVGPKYHLMAEKRLSCLRGDAEASAIFLKRDSSGDPQAPPVGTIIRQPALARTIERLASRGPGEFYRGPIGRAVVETIRARGGILTAEDLRAYKTQWRSPIVGTYRGYRFATMPPPSAGGVAIVQVLGMMQAAGKFPYRDPRGLHWFVESVRRAFVDRFKYMGDPAFVDIPLSRLTSSEYIAQLAQTVDAQRATPSVSLLASGAASRADEGKHTAHVSVIDKDGNAVSLTTTINYLFGSCTIAKGTGILLNDQMDDFSTRPGQPNAYGLIASPANAVGPKKIPLSSMAPTVVFQKENPEKVQLVVGSPGGSTIPTTVIQVIQNVIDYGMNVSDAVSAGRLHHQLYPDEILADARGLDPETEKALAGMGHRIRRAESWGDAEAVMVDPATGLRYAASDSRNEGAALGQD